MVSSVSERIAPKLASNHPERPDPVEETLRELFTDSIGWIFFWTTIASLGWVAFKLISLFVNTNSKPNHLVASVGGAVFAFVVALTILMLSERRNTVAANIMKALKGTTRRYAFPLTLIFGLLIGAYWDRHSVDPRPPRYVAVACTRTPNCTQEAVRLSASEVDVEVYLIETAR